MDLPGKECEGSGARHCAVLRDGQNTEMEWGGHAAGSYVNRQHQETLVIPDFRGKIPIIQAEILRKGKKQKIFLEG